MQTSDIQKVGILGGGAWGTALALAVHRAGCHVTQWVREPDLADHMTQNRENTTFLPGISLPTDIHITSNPVAALETDVVLAVTPAQHLGATLSTLAPDWPEALPIVVSCKGIEIATGRLMSDVVQDILPGRPVAVMSGPTFAIETAHNQPTALTIASDDTDLPGRLVTAFGHHTFRPYASHDLIGVQIGGALKNVIAIACGFVTGLGLGDNARAALITRGLAEITRYAVAHGAQLETMMGLSGQGDLVLTCSSITSRNYSLGAALGEGRRLSDVLAERSSVAEGVPTATAVVKEARQRNIDMPISTAVHAVLSEALTAHEAMDQLLMRPFRFETERTS